MRFEIKSIIKSINVRSNYHLIDVLIFRIIDPKSYHNFKFMLINIIKYTYLKSIISLKVDVRYDLQVSIKLIKS